MKFGCILGLISGSLVTLLSGCKKEEPVVSEPSLAGVWQADSLHLATVSGNVTGPTTTLLPTPNTTLTITGSTFSDVGSLGLGGTAASPAVYTYTRNSNSITLSNSSGSMQYTGTINALTDHRLQLAFVRPVGLSGTSLQYQEVFYSR